MLLKINAYASEYHISLRDYVNIDNSADATFIVYELKIFQNTNKEADEEEDNDEEKNITTNEIMFEEDYKFKKSLSNGKFYY